MSFQYLPFALLSYFSSPLLHISSAKCSTIYWILPTSYIYITLPQYILASRFLFYSCELSLNNVDQFQVLILYYYVNKGNTLGMPSNVMPSNLAANVIKLDKLWNNKTAPWMLWHTQVICDIFKECLGKAHNISMEWCGKVLSG